ncbi:pyridoxal phosphate-dependent transferase [Mycena vitilis]|nr:pyridoxal phosphate-dependent transferase [Mycena vitilis]
MSVRLIFFDPTQLSRDAVDEFESFYVETTGSFVTVPWRQPKINSLLVVRTSTHIGGTGAAWSKRDAEPPSHSVTAYSGSGVVSTDALTAYQQFLHDFPGYKLTWILDTLRRTDYNRLLDAGQTYVDYMSGALYPESLIRIHTDFLNRSVLGNAQAPASAAADARAAVLAFFGAPAEEYTVIFTPNAPGALKLVGESYPFTYDSSYMLACDSHNSVHGIREFAERGGARVCYIPSTGTGGFDATIAHPDFPEEAPSLFVMTAQSNISNAKNSLSTIRYASSLGYDTVLDAAALAPTSTISLTDYPIDAMAVSFYKMFGFPTGVGALIAKKSFLRRLRRPWFAGGTVDIVQVPGTIATPARDLHAQFEDGTTNYLSLPAVTDGLRFLSAYMPFLPLRLSNLLQYLASSLSQLRHDNTDAPVVRILSAVPSNRLTSVGAQSDVGSILSLLFLSPTGDILPNSFIAHAASRMCISLRTGSMCNPGGAAAILGIENAMDLLYEGATFADFERTAGHELGVVRVSLGLASNFQDAWNFLRFARLISQYEGRMALWAGWVASLQPEIVGGDQEEVIALTLAIFRGVAPHGPMFISSSSPVSSETATSITRLQRRFSHGQVGTGLRQMN